MAEPNAPSILIISAHFPPSPSVGGKRPHKIARVLADSGWKTTVLTIGDVATIEHHPSTSGEFVVAREAPFLPKKFLRRFQPGSNSGGSSSESKSLATDRQRTPSQVLRKAIGQTLTRIQGIDEWAWWNRSIGKTLTQSKFDIVLVTIPPFSIALGAIKLAQRLQAKLVLDYRDPWSDLPDKDHYQRIHGRDMTSVFDDMESRCLDAAQLVFTVSPAIERMLKNRRSDLQIKTVPQGFTGPIHRSDSVEDFFLYAGSLAYGRSLSEVLAALVKLNHGRERKIKLKYCGEHNDFAEQQARAIGAFDLLENLGTRAQSEVDELAFHALASFVIVSPQYEYAYPGKIFDLINSGRPIFVISQEPCEAGKLVEEYGLGRSFDRESLEQLASALENLVRAPEFPYGNTIGSLEDRVVLTQLEASLRELIR